MSRLGEARAAKVKRSASVPWGAMPAGYCLRSEEHTSELQSRSDLVCRLLLEKKKKDSEFLFSISERRGEPPCNLLPMHRIDLDLAYVEESLRPTYRLHRSTYRLITVRTTIS